MPDPRRSAPVQCLLSNSVQSQLALHLQAVTGEHLHVRSYICWTTCRKAVEFLLLRLQRLWTKPCLFSEGNKPFFSAHSSEPVVSQSMQLRTEPTLRPSASHIDDLELFCSGSPVVSSATHLILMACQDPASELPSIPGEQPEGAAG